MCLFAAKGFLILCNEAFKIWFELIFLPSILNVTPSCFNSPFCSNPSLFSSYQSIEFTSPLECTFLSVPKVYHMKYRFVYWQFVKISQYFFVQNRGIVKNIQKLFTNQNEYVILILECCRNTLFIYIIIYILD